MSTDASYEVHPTQAEPPFVLAIDVGSSSVRALLFDRFARSIQSCHARQSVTFETQTDGAAVINADLLLEVTWNCIDEVLSKANSLVKDIVGVGNCTLVSNILGLDKMGSAITPIFTYADTRGMDDVAILRNQMDENETHQRTGCILHPSYLPVRFHWIRRVHPELWERVSHWMTIGEYMLFKLFGETAVSYSVASWSGMLNRHKLVWDDQFFNLLSIPSGALSKLVDLDVKWCGLRKPFTDRWPGLVNTPWFPAVGDGAAVNVGSGCLDRQCLAITMGTSTAIRVLLDDVPKIPQGLWCYRLDQNASLLGGALSEGGNVLEWLNHIFQMKETTEFESELTKMLPGEHGLTFLPLLAGERSPGWIGSARGIIAGLSLATEARDIYHAGLEALACRIGLVYERVISAIPHDAKVVVSGGVLLHSPLLRQILSDVLGAPISTFPFSEPSSRGISMLVLRSLGIVPDLGTFPCKIDDVVHPDPENHKRYQEIIRRQTELYQQMILEDRT